MQLSQKPTKFTPSELNFFVLTNIPKKCLLVRPPRMRVPQVTLQELKEIVAPTPTRKSPRLRQGAVASNPQTPSTASIPAFDDEFGQWSSGFRNMCCDVIDRAEQMHQSGTASQSHRSLAPVFSGSPTTGMPMHATLYLLWESL